MLLTRARNLLPITLAGALLMACGDKDALPKDAAAPDGTTTAAAGSAAAGDALAVPLGDRPYADTVELGGGEEAVYRLEPTAGQAIDVHVRGVSNGSVTLELRRPGGEVVATSADAELAEMNQLRHEAEAAGPLELAVRAAEGAPDLSFDLIVAGGPAAGGASGQVPAGSQPPEEEAEHIQFQSGEDGGVVQGDLEGAGALRSYLLAGEEGDSLAILLESEPEGAVDLMLFSPTERPMRALPDPGPAGEDVYPLPEDGDYRITLSSREARASFSLTLRLAAPAEAAIPAGIGAGDAPAEAPPTRMIFAPGHTQTQIQGALDGASPARYVLHAAGGETLAVALEADAGSQPQVYVEDAQGKVLASGLTVEPLRVRLPASADYWVTLQVPPQSGSVGYVMNIGLE